MVDVNAPYQSYLDQAVPFAQWQAVLPHALSDSDRRRLRNACRLAERAYAGRQRDSGESYASHAQAVAMVLAELNLDADVIIAGLLHDLPRLGRLTPENWPDELDDTVVELIRGAARIDTISNLHERADRQGGGRVEPLRKMVLAMARDIRVVFIALAVRLVDCHRLDQRSVEERQRMARQTLALHAPLANRLGLSQIKWRLQDLSLRAETPEQYRHIAGLLAGRLVERERDIAQLQSQLSTALSAAGIDARVSGRPKHIFSIWQKMQRKNMGFSGLFDIRAFRVLVDDVDQCYAALGVIHELWTPLTSEYTDYIATPKANNYQSLHTVLQAPDGHNLEVQIRTHAMHRRAELGVAAHWRYKEGGERDSAFDAKVAWLRELLQWAQSEAGEYEPLGRYRTELFEDRVYVLTPLDDVIDLPRGATPLDFAYRIHTQVGHQCRGARVNGAMVPLTRVLHTGDRVTVQTGRNAGPSRDWLNPALGYLASPRARSQVQRWFRELDFDRHAADGRATLERELRRLNASGEINLDTLASRAGMSSLNAFLAAIGRGEVTATRIVDLVRALRSEQRPAEPVRPQRQPPRHSATAVSSDDVIIDGVDNLLTRLAGCCQPTSDDAIVGFVTRHYGITVHRRDCSNIRSLDVAARQRLIDAQWRTVVVDGH